MARRKERETEMYRVAREIREGRVQKGTRGVAVAA